MLLREIIDIIESAAPLSAQESWDNSGLQIGHRSDDVTSVLLCTDVTESVIAEAVAIKAQLVISHHPLLFHGLKTLAGNTPQQRITEEAIRHGIAVYSSHTAMDVQPAGVSGYAALLIGVHDAAVLSPAGGATGLGVIGTLDTPMSLSDMLERLSQVFGQQCIRYANPTDRMLWKVAFVGGSGAEFIADAVEQGADIFISADIRHHDFTDWLGSIPIVDIGHFESEQFTKHIFRRLLEGRGLRIYDAMSDKTPVKWYCKAKN